jgi:thymidylate synthase (FAD)
MTTIEKGFEIKVLDQGFVRFVDSLGTDETIVEAARMSTGRGFVSWEPYKRCKKCDSVSVSTGAWQHGDYAKFAECAGDHDWLAFPRGDFGILDFLYKMGHTTPFEMCELIIDVQVPMDSWRQWIRHRTASVNEYSTRYTEAIDIMAKTLPGEWRLQGVTNRQGSGAFLPVGQEEHAPIAGSGGALLSQREAEFHALAREIYEERLAMGVAKEQARKDLPLSNYTAARWKIDLHNLLHIFLSKRMHHHAQKEIRDYANAVAEIVRSIWPRSYALFEEYDRFGVHLSRTEAAVVHQFIQYAQNDFVGKERGVVDFAIKHGLDERGAKDLIAKLVLP